MLATASQLPLRICRWLFALDSRGVPWSVQAQRAVLAERRVNLTKTIGRTASVQLPSQKESASSSMQVCPRPLLPPYSRGRSYSGMRIHRKVEAAYLRLGDTAGFRCRFNRSS